MEKSLRPAKNSDVGPLLLIDEAMVTWELPLRVERTKLVALVEPVCNIFASPVPNLTTGRPTDVRVPSGF